MHGLQELIVSIGRMDQEDEPPVRAADLDLLLYAPCPVKLAARERIEAIGTGYAARGDSLKVHIPMGCTSIDPYDPLVLETDPDRLPAVIASLGFGDFWRREFADRFVRTGLFEAVAPEEVHPLHLEAGLPDPRGAYTIYGVTPYIFLADLERLDGTEPPRTWEDLLDPRYRGQVVMCGDGDDMADAVLLSLYKDFGLDGVRGLAANVRGLMHSSTMAAKAGKGGKGGAVHIIPAFFAESARQPAHVRVVWPDDGAAASPLYCLAKKSAHGRLAGLLEFFRTGFASIPGADWFVPASGGGRSPLPPGARLKWVGWEFVEANDVNRLRDELGAAFRAMLQAAGSGQDAGGGDACAS